MKALKKTSWLLLLIFTFFGCSSAKVIHQWKADEAALAAFEDDHMLVIARTGDDYTRIALETALTKGLRAQGINAVASFEEFAILKTDRELSQEERIKLENHIEEVGYNGVLITTIKQIDREIHTQKEEVLVGGSYGGYYPANYYGLYNYYYQPYWNSPYYANNPNFILGSGEVITTTRTNVSVTYVLETLGFDLDVEEQEKLVFVVAARVKDPGSIEKEANDYAKLTLDQLLASQ